MEQVNPTHTRKYSIKQIKDIIRESSGGQKYINANINNEQALRREGRRLLANKRRITNIEGFPLSDTNPSKMWRNFYFLSNFILVKIVDIFNWDTLWIKNISIRLDIIM